MCHVVGLNILRNVLVTVFRANSAFNCFIYKYYGLTKWKAKETVKILWKVSDKK